MSRYYKLFEHGTKAIAFSLEEQALYKNNNLHTLKWASEHYFLLYFTMNLDSLLQIFVVQLVVNMDDGFSHKIYFLILHWDSASYTGFLL